MMKVRFWSVCLIHVFKELIDIICDWVLYGYDYIWYMSIKYKRVDWFFDDTKKAMDESDSYTRKVRG